MVVDISHEFLYDVLESDDAGAEAELVAYQRPADMTAFHFFQDCVDIHVLMEIYRLMHHFLQIE